MDIIYTDASGVDKGIIQSCTLDYEASTDKDECTFEVKTSLTDLKIEKGGYIYIENEEYGGRIDSIKIDTSKKEVYGSGRSWRGILGSKIIVPPAGSNYYTATGSIKSVIEDLVEYTDLDELVSVDNIDGNITSYQFYRYTDLYSGLIKMLASVGKKAVFRYRTGKVHISAIDITDFENERELTSDMVDFVITTSTSVNHVIGLGKGELADRQVVHKYLDADGNVTDDQYYFGSDEYAVTYENTDCEPEELEEKTQDRLKQLAASDTLEINAYNLGADIGDRLTAHELTTGTKVIQYVTKKIFTISNQVIKIQYKVGNKI